MTIRWSNWMAARRLMVGAAMTLAAAGCRTAPSMHAPMAIRSERGEQVLAFDMNSDGRPDYWQYLAADGRKHAIAFAAGNAVEPGERIELDRVDAAHCPHLLIAMDGVPFELVEQLHRKGRFRLFSPPSRVICTFPSMTDLALSQLFHSPPCKAFEALYLDRRTNRLSDGNATYLSAANVPWLSKVNYRCSFAWDAKAYLDPQAVFDHELEGITKTFKAVQSGEAFAYTVGTAGLGTTGGREAILRYLRTIDDLCERIVYERRGQVKLTLTADHGHNLTPFRMVSFDDTLQRAGFRPSQSLAAPQDVITIRYGLVTYAAFYTARPAAVADCLLGHDDVELACYPDGDRVIVRDRNGRAGVRKIGGRHAYQVERGDPLQLAPIIEKLRAAGSVASDGGIDDAALFAATAVHIYPDPLRRLWEAFHGLAEMPPDLVVTLRDGACHGSRFFHFMLRSRASTHGSLNRSNSTTFLLTMLGQTPAAMRTGDVMPALERFREAEHR